MKIKILKKTRNKDTPFLQWMIKDTHLIEFFLIMMGTTFIISGFMYINAYFLAALIVAISNAFRSITTGWWLLFCGLFACLSGLLLGIIKIKRFSLPEETA